MNQPDHRTEEGRIELSVGRDPDGDVNFEIYIDSHNLVSVSVASDGAMNWAGILGGKTSHGNGANNYGLGQLIFGLLDSRVKGDDDE